MGSSYSLDLSNDQFNHFVNFYNSIKGDTPFDDFPAYEDLCNDYADGVFTCDGTGFFEEINLSGFGLTGDSFNITALQQLTSLKTLDLSDNRLNFDFVTVLHEILDNTNIEVVLLNNVTNGVATAAPATLFNIDNPNAHVIELSSNNLFGPLPQIKVAASSILQRIDLSHNNFNGDIQADFITPEGAYTYLDLDLSHNELQGQIPAEFWQVGIPGIDLSYNNFNSTLDMVTTPSLSAQGYEISYLNLRSNNFYGRYPQEFMELHYDPPCYYDKCAYSSASSSYYSSSYSSYRPPYYYSSSSSYSSYLKCFIRFIIL